MAKIDYLELKKAIIKSASGIDKSLIGFQINYEKLSKLVTELGLTVINVGMKSKKVEMDDIALLSEYFKGLKLSWFDRDKEFTTLVFVPAEYIDDDCKELLTKMDLSSVDDPELDKVETLASIIAKYPCYFATVVSYKSNEPKRFGKPSYEIKCRANTVCIKRQEYEYNHEDMS